MKFTSTLIKGKLIKRYKRFFIDIKVNNQIITAHCPNTGSMMGLLDKDNEVWVSKNDDPKRKLKYTLQIIEVNGIKFCINTHITNKIIQESLSNKLIKELKNYALIRPEKKFGKNTRFDFLLRNIKNDKKTFLEVKSVSLSRKKGHAEFPDAVTERGKKHLENLILANQQGYESYLFFLIQVENCKTFGIASDIDPIYFEAFKKALKKNVKVLCYDCKFYNKGIEINKKIDILIDGK